jgi:low affinity Fe/Cu permease
MRDVFNAISDRITRALGSPFALAIAAAIILVWLLTGPVFGFSDTWQLVINTATTIVTFLMVFVIQASQNRDSKAIHAKLDELIRSIRSARNEFLDAEEEPEAWLDLRIGELRALARSKPHLAGRIADHVAQLAIPDQGAPTDAGATTDPEARTPGGGPGAR